MPARLLLALALATLTGCGGGSGGQGGSSRTLRVPSAYPTVQKAVDASRPGDLVLIAPGAYHEEIKVEEDHPRIVIRGTDRNDVVLDGHDQMANGVFVEADGVAVENLTIRHYVVNGLVFAPERRYGKDGRYLQGWRGSYLTAYDNGLYGVYAFGAQHGRFDHVYASGHPDSGVYVGRCRPCFALVRDSIAEHNHVGYEGTNSGGHVQIVGNTWSRNRVGVQVNSLVKERGAPQVESLIAGNVIADNQDAGAPRGSEGFGAGIVIAGGRRNLVTRNRVTGNRRVGVVVTDSDDFGAQQNRVVGNRLSDNGVDLALIGGRGNCFTANGPSTTAPKGLRCGPGRGRLPELTVPGQVDYRTLPAPPDQPSMPGGASAPARPATGLPERIDPAAVRVPR